MSRSAEERTRRWRTSLDISSQSPPSPLHEAGVKGTSLRAMFSTWCAPGRDRGPPNPEPADVSLQLPLDVDRRRRYGVGGSHESASIDRVSTNVRYCAAGCDGSPSRRTGPEGSLGTVGDRVSLGTTPPV